MTEDIGKGMTETHNDIYLLPPEGKDGSALLVEKLSSSTFFIQTYSYIWHQLVRCQSE